MKIITVLTLCMISSVAMRAQDSVKVAEEVNMNDEFTLEQLMDIKLSVGAQKELTNWQTPSIISVITAEDIRNLAPRDINDILRIIPGFELASDIQGYQGVGVRGAWGSEGKVLVLFDGMQMNENLYGTTALGAHFDVNQIDRIEVVRGPGYAYYNGFASLGVINIITKKGAQLQGGEASVAYGQLSTVSGHQLASLQGGFNKGKWDIVASAYAGKAQRYQGMYSDYFGNSQELSMNNNAVSLPRQFRVSAAYKDLNIKLFYDDFNGYNRLFYGPLLNQSTNFNFSNRQVDVYYKWQVNEKWKIVPRVNVNYNRPWTNNDIDVNSDTNYIYYDRMVLRNTVSVTSNFELKEYLHWNFGAGAYHDEARGVENVNKPSYNDYAIEQKYLTVFAFNEFFVDYKKTTASVGLRWENNSAFGNVFLPRVAATQNFGKLNLKASYGQAFRAPLVENIYANPKILPEKTSTAEIELAYKMSDLFVMSVNVFSNEIKDVIVYGTDGKTDLYLNEKEIDTKGAEFQFNFKKEKYGVSGSYSYYQNVHQYVDAYITPDEASLLGFANHKVSLIGHADLTDYLSWNVNAVVLSKKWTVSGYDINGNYVMSQLPESYTLNSSLVFHKIPKCENLSIAFSCYNILNNKYYMVQAFKGDLPAIPTLGREIFVKVGYTFK